jgi:thiamine-monophosphate kinase
MPTIADVGEHRFIEAIRQRYSMDLAGDDGAVLETLTTPVVTTDSFHEDIHFRRSWAKPDVLAARLVQATLSDLAAMGAQPRYLFSSVALPPETDFQWLMDFYGGLSGLESCPLAGGETIRGRAFCVTLTALGDCMGRPAFLRRNARPGDTLWVTGPLGRSLDSPMLLDRGQLSFLEQQQVNLFQSPVARFDAVPVLREAGVRAAIDISDGLFSECGHLSVESGVEIRLNLDLVPLVPYCAGRPVEACSAGEDFELLFTLPRGKTVEGFFRIGTVAKGSGLSATLDGSPLKAEASGYDHFTGA